MVKLVKSSVDLYHLTNMDMITHHIEKCGRTCYKSEAHITPQSADRFITGILKSGHESVIEHAHLIFELERTNQNKMALFDCLGVVQGLNITEDNQQNIFIISGNMRTFRDIFRRTGIIDFNNIFQTNQSLSIFTQETNNTEPTFQNLKLINVQNSSYGDEHNYATAHIVCDISLYKDITRHRLCSFSIESTRYCNYSKDRFGSELVMLQPVNIQEGTPEFNLWFSCMQEIEKNYMTMASLPEIKADQLRMMLPHSTKADVIMTCSFKEWKHIFSLRCAKQAHPSVRQGMLQVLNLLYQAYPNSFEEEYNQFKEDIELFKQLS